jgi:soluble lytic murein transglycosylase
LKYTAWLAASILALACFIPAPAPAGTRRPAPPPAVRDPALSEADQALRDGWKLLLSEKFPSAREKFRKIPTEGYELADYVVGFTGLSFVREERLAEAAASWDNLVAAYPRSPLVPLLAIDLAFLSARQDNLALARRWFDIGQGRAFGSERKAEEGYVGARLLEANDPVRAAEQHLQNFVAYTAHEGGTLSADRLAGWHREGRFQALGLPVAFYARFAKSLFRSGDPDLARLFYREALRKFPRDEAYYSLMFDFAELLRKEGDTRGSRALLDQAISASPAGICSEASFLLARVRWKSGNLSEARSIFDNIASAGLCRPAVAERALHLAAWIAEEEGDLPGLTNAFGKLRTAEDLAIRQEAIFRHAFGLYRLNLFAEAIPEFEAGARGGYGPVERARHLFWKARSLEGAGRKAEAEADYRRLAADPGAGIYALFAIGRLGRDPYAMFNAPSSMETQSCAADRGLLWDRLLRADWDKDDAEKLRRAERLARMGLLEYSVLEAERIDRAKVRRKVGIAEGGTAGFFRFLAGDLRGALREADRLPTDPDSAGLLEKIQFPLAPDMVGDCDLKRSGMDPLVLHSVIRQESQFSPTILSPAGAVGLMQLMPRTATETARRSGLGKPRKRDLVNPSVNVELGAAYLSRLVRGYDGDYMRAVAAYNAGESSVSKWWGRSGGDPAMFLENISYRETRGYVRRVFFNLLQYYRIYRPQMLAGFLASVPTKEPPAPGAPGTPPTGATPAADPAPKAAEPGG